MPFQKWKAKLHAFLSSFHWSIVFHLGKTIRKELVHGEESTLAMPNNKKSWITLISKCHLYLYYTKSTCKNRVQATFRTSAQDAVNLFLAIMTCRQINWLQLQSFSESIHLQGEACGIRKNSLLSHTRTQSVISPYCKLLECLACTNMIYIVVAGKLHALCEQLTAYLEYHRLLCKWLH